MDPVCANVKNHQAVRPLLLNDPEKFLKLFHADINFYRPQK